MRRQLEQRAYGAITREQEAENKLQKIRAHDKLRRREQKRKLAQAHRECQKAIARYEVFEAALSKAREALESIDLESGEWRTAEQAQIMLESAAQALQSLDHTPSQKGSPLSAQSCSGALTGYCRFAHPAHRAYHPIYPDSGLPGLPHLAIGR